MHTSSRDAQTGVLSLPKWLPWLFDVMPKIALRVLQGKASVSTIREELYGAFFSNPFGHVDVPQDLSESA